MALAAAVGHNRVASLDRAGRSQVCPADLAMHVVPWRAAGGIAADLTAESSCSNRGDLRRGQSSACRGHFAPLPPGQSDAPAASVFRDFFRVAGADVRLDL